jgi:hypothetical protein
MSRPRHPAKIARLRPQKLTVSCPDCDVTWRGTLRDACWHCGGHRTTEAPPAQVKVVS